MEYKTVVKLDLTNCKYLGEMHERIRVAFDWPEWYGQNWSAFCDLLWSDCTAEEIIVTGSNTVSKELITYVEKMKELLEREKAHRMKYDEKFEVLFIDESDTDIEYFKF